MLSGRRHRSTPSFFVSDTTCTICICVSVLAWLLCGLLFIHVFINNNNDASGAGQAPTTISNNGDSGGLPSFFHEYDRNTGWKPIYVENLGVRMPSEQMNAILEKYWIPQAKEKFPHLFPNEKENDNNNNKQESQQKNKNKQQKQQNRNENRNSNSNSNSNNNKQNKIDNGITVTVNSQDYNGNSLLKREFTNIANAELVYPKKWFDEGVPCQNDPFDTQCVSQHLQYWKRGTSAVNQPAKVE